MANLIKLDGSTVKLGKGRPRSTWKKLDNGDYREMTEAEIVAEREAKVNAQPQQVQQA